MRIINILGSPRPSGNGATIAQLLTNILESHHNEIITYELNKLVYRGCQACMACKKSSETCVVKDDLTPILKDIREADVVLLSTPIYFGEVTAQAKGLIDRLYSLFGADYRTNPHPSRLAKGKQLVLILPQGNADESAFADVGPRYERIFTRLGFDEIIPIRALGATMDCDVLSNESIVETVKKTASKLETTQSIR